MMSAPAVVIKAAGKKKRKPNFRPVRAAAGAPSLTVTNKQEEKDDDFFLDDANINIDNDGEQPQPLQADDPSKDNERMSNGSRKPGAKVAIRVRPRKLKSSSAVLPIGASRKKASSGENQKELEGEEGECSSSTALVVSHQTPLPVENDMSNENGRELQPPKRREHLPQELIPPVIPPNMTGQPSLTAFCTAYPRPKKLRRSERNNGDEAAKAAKAKASEATMLPPPPQQQQQPTVLIVNGEIVLQESSVVFHGVGAGTNATDEDNQQNNRNTNMTIVEEESDMAVVRSSYTSYATGKRVRQGSQHWSVEETQLFYEALRQVGVDFGCMEAYFNNQDEDDAGVINNNNNKNSVVRQRNRRQLKNKYSTELKRNPHLVESALQPAGRVDIDLSVFELTPQQVEEMAAKQKEQEKQDAQEEQEKAAEQTDAMHVSDEAEVLEESYEDDQNLRRVGIGKLPSSGTSSRNEPHDAFWSDASHPKNGNNDVTTSRSNTNINNYEVDEDDVVVEDPGFAEEENDMDPLYPNDDDVDALLFKGRVDNDDNLLHGEGNQTNAATTPALTLVYTTSPNKTSNKNKITKPNFRAAAAAAARKKHKM